MTKFGFFNHKNFPVNLGWAEEVETFRDVDDRSGTGRFHLRIASPGPWRVYALCGKIVHWGRSLVEGSQDHKCHECAKLDKERQKSAVALTPSR